jgi:Major intrinsic protein
MTKENMPANREESPREPGTAESPAAGDIAGHRLGPSAVGTAFRRTHQVFWLEFGNRADFDDPRREWRRLFSELLGTFALVLVAAGGGLLHAKGQISLAAAVVAPGLIVTAIILFMGAVSGAHLNTVVSVAFALRGTSRGGASPATSSSSSPARPWRPCFSGGCSGTPSISGPRCQARATGTGRPC